MITQNELKYLKSLSQRKFRQKYNKFIAEGNKICAELLNAESYGIDRIYCTNDWASEHVIDRQRFKEIVTICTEKDIGRVSQLRSANQVVMVLSIPSKPSSLEAQSDTVIYLDDVQDPGNVGTIIRIADWYGIKTVVRSAATADFYNPKVVQATMASFANVKLETASLAILRQANPDYQTVGAILGGKNLREFEWPSKSIIVMGNESKGVTPETMKALDHRLMIAGSSIRLADSLNVGIATALMCQERFDL